MIIDTFVDFGPTKVRMLKISLNDGQKKIIDKYLTKLKDMNEHAKKYAYDRLSVLVKMIYFESPEFKKEALLIIKDTKNGCYCGKSKEYRRLVKKQGAGYSRKWIRKSISEREKTRASFKKVIDKQCKARKLKLDEWD